MINLATIITFLGDAVIKVMGSDNLKVDGVGSVTGAGSSQISFISNISEKAHGWIHASDAAVLIVPTGLEVSRLSQKTFVFVDVPRLQFARIVDKYFTKDVKPHIHETAIIHPNSTVDKSATIGPYVVIDEHCNIGANTIIHAHVHIYENTRIGDRVIINSGSSIGQDGFGYERLESGEVFKFPHLGGVILEDGVEIGANACVDRGTLSDTIIRKGARVDNLVHVAHNCDVGEQTYLIAQSHLGGSVKIGRECWISPLGAIRNGCSVGDRTMVGMMTLVTKPVGDNITVAGVPALPLSDFISQQKAIKKLIK